MKWVLVRSLHGGYFILDRKQWNEMRRIEPYNSSVVVAESNDRADLEKFRNLTKED